ncbi:MAG TPA: glutamate synthase central domain-containing protein, partial [Actinomycetes bacterium]|nr:glutamate synthase central domain-containing protein [Actinomycetes bacterium]
MPAPPPQGLYTGRHEHDSCGVAFVATLTGDPSRDIVDHAFTALRNLRHRGASGSEPDSGDGAGILVQIPDVFLRAVVDFELPPPGSYAAGLVFLPHDDEPTVTRIGELAAEEKLAVLGWRDVPVHAGIVGTTARRVMPRIRQVFVRGDAGEAGLDLDRRTYRLRKRAERETEAYFPSLSARTLVYKGMLTPDQLQPFFLDLSDPRFASALALVHSRFSTNTFPSWPLAHPYRFIAHNGEINTVMGNRNWMRAREATLATAHIPGRFTDLFPLLTVGGSDSASFDEALELLTLGGYELPHAVLMMIPEAWENDARMDAARRAFYAYHAGLMEAWDGPASITFTDGSLVGAVLDRNGLRPGRFWVTDDGLVVLASEAGVLDIRPSRVVRKGRLQPGRMFLVDLDAGRIIEDDEIKARLAAAHPYQAWLDANLTNLPQSPSHEGHLHPIGRGEGHIHLPGDRGNGATTRPGQQRNPPPTQDVAKFRSALLHQQRLFGYTEEELRVLVAPMARDGAEPIGSMGTDTPLAVLSERPRLLFDYFTQLFAQVTNPPLDAIREELVTSLQVRLGPQDNLLAPGPDACRQIVLPYPVLDRADLAALRQLRGFPAATITATY